MLLPDAHLRRTIERLRREIAAVECLPTGDFPRRLGDRRQYVRELRRQIRLVQTALINRAEARALGQLPPEDEQ